VNSLWNGQGPLFQEMCLLLVKWFHWILSEFIGCTKQDLVGIQQIHLSIEQGLVNCTHIL